MFGMHDVVKFMPHSRRNGSAGKGLMLFALGAAVGVGVSRMGWWNQGQNWQEDTTSGPAEVDI